MSLYIHNLARLVYGLPFHHTLVLDLRQCTVHNADREYDGRACRTCVTIARCYAPDRVAVVHCEKWGPLPNAVLTP